MTLLQRHIFRQVLWACLWAVGLFAFVLVVGNVVKDLFSSALAGRLSLADQVKLTLLLVPYVGAYALPMGVITGVLLVLGRMSAQQEITAVRAAGMSLMWVARPILVLALLGVAAAWFVNFYQMPRARTAYVQLRDSILRQNPLNAIQPRTFIRDFKGVVVYAARREGNELAELWIWQLDEQQRVVMFARAGRGSMDYHEADAKLVLRLTDVTIETRDEEAPETFVKGSPVFTTDSLAVDLPLENVFQRRRQKFAWMTLDELRTAQARLAQPLPPEATAEERATQAQDAVRVRVTLHDKAANAFGVLALALVGIPLGIRVSRKETSANLGVALLLVLGYYFLNTAVSWLDDSPALHPDLLRWVPPLLFLALGTVMMRRVGRV